MQNLANDGFSVFERQLAEVKMRYDNNKKRMAIELLIGISLFSLIFQILDILIYDFLLLLLPPIFLQPQAPYR